MNSEFKNAFDKISASDKLKGDMAVYLKTETAKRRQKKYIPMRYAAALCSVFLFVVFGTIGYGYYKAPVSYISIDMNPSVELSLNRFNRIVGIESYNEGGDAVLQNLSGLKNKVYTKAISMLLSENGFQRYVEPDSLLTFTVIADSSKEGVLLSGIKESSRDVSCESQYHSAGHETKEAAEGSGLSFGKYRAYEELVQYEPSISVDECRHMSMNELRDEIEIHAHGGHGENGSGGGHSGSAGSMEEEDGEPGNHAGTNKHGGGHGHGE